MWQVMAEQPSNHQAKPQQSNQATTEDILTIFKRRGLFDSLRKSLFTDFKESPTHESLIAAIESLVESDSSATLATRNRGKAAALLEGSVNRSEAFGNVNKYIDEHVSTRNEELRRKIEDMVRQINTELRTTTHQKDIKKPETNGDAE
ncbi:complex proteins associated with Set1p component shg1-domain-containing protein [Lipomyces chichibuensis]|uniref:complex proteins associated with Set1p component shg1-domain-containing protein n=1 Tax=Lipomyces chichibuensis TaxID=1546026 RepID=UPI0033440E2F